MSTKKNIFYGSEDCCGFCGGGSETQNICGTLFASKGCVAHKKCMQYSSNLAQYESDMGFGGFEIDEVQKEMRRSHKLTCFKCKAEGNTHAKRASAGCAFDKCAKSFHYFRHVLNAKLRTCFKCKTEGNTHAKRASAGCAFDKCAKSFHYFCASQDDNCIADRMVCTFKRKNEKKKRTEVHYRIFCGDKHKEMYINLLKRKAANKGEEMTVECDTLSDDEDDVNNDDIPKKKLVKTTKKLMPASSESDIGESMKKTKTSKRVSDQFEIEGIEAFSTSANSSNDDSDDEKHPKKPRATKSRKRQTDGSYSPVAKKPKRDESSDISDEQSASSSKRLSSKQPEKDVSKTKDVKKPTNDKNLEGGFKKKAVNDESPTIINDGKGDRLKKKMVENESNKRPVDMKEMALCLVDDTRAPNFAIDIRETVQSMVHANYNLNGDSIALYTETSRYQFVSGEKILFFMEDIARALVRLSEEGTSDKLKDLILNVDGKVKKDYAFKVEAKNNYKDFSKKIEKQIRCDIVTKMEKTKETLASKLSAPKVGNLHLLQMEGAEKMKMYVLVIILNKITDSDGGIRRWLKSGEKDPVQSSPYYQWTPSTTFTSGLPYSNKNRAFHEEATRIKKCLSQKLGDGYEVDVLPKDELIQDSTKSASPAMVATQMHLMSQGAEDGDSINLVGVTVIQPLDSKIVHQYTYIKKAITKAVEDSSTSAFLIDVSYLKELEGLKSIIPDSVTKDVQVFSAYNPEQQPITCVLVILKL
ncbi:unnamed protein product [Owenia fusiformis]|uniref:Uncharacterized protein n=1 Tax=Owenia fusiformis TaxID=6347 RepID=A0A8S4Q323_OWEFU|nr:unnamed protein product [Owenia fusiformis]